MKSHFYMLCDTVFSVLGIVWYESETGPKIKRVYLPDEDISVEDRIKRNYFGVTLHTCRVIEEIGVGMQDLLRGDAVDFDLNMISLRECSDFQKSVLLADYKIPRGCVSTYSRIANRLGFYGYARAVGRALSLNPFPLIIPCHRVIKSNGEIGGYQGGGRMKKALLEYEGTEVTQKGKILMDRVF